MDRTRVDFIDPDNNKRPDSRRLGFWARSTLGPHLIETLERYNLEVRSRAADQTYDLFSKTDGQHPDMMLPDFIERIDHTDRGVVLDMAALQDALEFLHQPVRVATENAKSKEYVSRTDQLLHEIAAGSHSAQALRREAKVIAKDIKDIAHRKTTQSILRFLTTGSTNIPVVKAAHSESDECHADEENKMRDKDAWMLNFEAGHKDQGVLFDAHNPPEDKIKTVPGFYFEPERGFVIQVHPKLINDTALTGESQIALRDALFSALGVETTPRAAAMQEIVLSPNEFSALCQSVHRIRHICELVNHVALEERAQARDERIAKACGALKDDLVFQAAAERSGMQDQDRRIALENIMVATSALTPIIGGAYTNKLWGDYFPSLKDDSPFDEVLSEYADMREKIEELLDQDVVTREELEAFALEYYKTLAFTDMAAGSLQDAAKDQNTYSIASRLISIGTGAAATGLAYLFTDTGGDTNLLNVIAYGMMAKSGFSTLDKILDAGLPSRQDKDQDLRIEIYSKMENLRHALHTTSVSGIHIDEAYLDDHHHDTLSVMRKPLGQDGSFGAQTLQAGKESGGEFIADIKNSFRDSAVTQIATVGTAGYLIYSSLQGDTTPAQAAADVLSSVPAEDGIGMGLEDFLGADAEELEVIPQPEEIDFSCHTDLKVSLSGAIQAYKHCIFGTLVEDQASNIISGTDYVLQRKMIDMIAHDRVNSFMSDHFGMQISGNDNSIFTSAARAAVKPVSGALMILNFLQNITHAGLWAYSAKKGWDVGFKGYRESFNFLNPILDIGRRAVRAPFAAVAGALDRVGVRVPFLPDPPRSVHDHLFRLINQSEGLGHIKPFKLADIDDRQGVTEDIAELAITVGGFKQRLDVSGERISTANASVDALDVKLRHMGQKIGVYEPWHHSMIRTHLDGVKNTLKRFEKSGDMDALKTGLEEHLGMLSGFEMRQIGVSDVFNALSVEHMDERTARVLSREANIAYGREERLAGRVRNTMHLIGADDKKPTLGSVARSGASILGNQALDKVVWASRSVQRGAHYIGDRPVLNYSLKGTAAALVGADALGILPENAVTEYMASALGSAYGGAATGGSFVVFNSGEDVLLVHTTMMSALITVGALSAIAMKKGVEPSTMASAEALREKWPSLDVLSGIKDIQGFSTKNIKNVGEKLDKASHRYGSAMQGRFSSIVRVPKSNYSDIDNEMSL